MAWIPSILSNRHTLRANRQGIPPRAGTGERVHGIPFARACGVQMAKVLQWRVFQIKDADDYVLKQ
jgi:hypothetical protein